MPANTTHPDYDANVVAWKKCRDCAKGQSAIHAAGEVYLPKLSGETKEDYDKRKNRALYFNATGRTLDAMTGMIFRKAPVVDVPASMAGIVADVDMGGKPLLSFCEAITEELVQVGRVGVLVEYPKADTTQGISVADAEKIGLRPYLALYKTESIINWEYGRVGNRTVLTKVVLAELEKVDGTDEFKHEYVEQWRVLDLFEGKYRVRIFRKVKDKQDPVQFGDDYFPLRKNSTITEIPFIGIAPNGLTLNISASPIDALADVNVSHYMLTADYEHGLHFTGLPTPVFAGFSMTTFDAEGQPVSKTISIGSSEGIVSDNADAKAYYLEFQGAGLQQIRDALSDKKDMMAALGARLLANDKRAAEAAETAVIHRAGENSVLASIANAVSSGLTNAFKWLAEWSSATGDISIALNTDYMPVWMTPQMLAELVKAYQAGTISFETLFWNLQEGEVIQAGRTLDEEKEAIADEVPVNGLVPQ